eukprot:CAMPEP_0205939488 /NCGR_PEP_ID=MMETSP1325-20131115/49758_1 /ASSEMBLY_ACC=CAM_ASM_000708 /TAXON_ID=236786 /ORGANISM="Florenciella sp., Strain RCC1007" /LENGTH=312 /DNA_ID=CAMNT_0053309963 /DNA_START=87 /DNA_END=1021 /DNA_ORIENTATION=-
MLSRGRTDYANANCVARMTHPGDICGLLQLFSGDGQLFTYIADPTKPTDSSDTAHQTGTPGTWGDKTKKDEGKEEKDKKFSDDYVVTLAIPTQSLQKLMCSEPSFMSWMFRHLMQRLSPLVFMLDWSLEWVHVNATEQLIQAGGDADSVYMVISGRLRAVNDRTHAYTHTLPNGYTLGSPRDTDRAEHQQQREEQQEREERQKEREEEDEREKGLDLFVDYSRGMLIGEAEMMTGERWERSIYAKRDAELVAMKRGALELVTLRYPRAALHFARRVAVQLKNKQRNGNNGGSIPRGLTPSEQPLAPPGSKPP